MNKPLKISEQAAVQKPMKTVASLIMMVALVTRAYFDLHETLNRPEQKKAQMKKDYLESNPDAKTMDNTTLKMPPKDYILPLPKPKDE